MAKTRSSTGAVDSSPQSAKSISSNSGTKRKAEEASPSSKAKRGRPSKAKEQKTLEETIPNAEDEDTSKGAEVDDAEPKTQETNGDAKHEEVAETKTNGNDDTVMKDNGETEAAAKDDEEQTTANAEKADTTEKTSKAEAAATANKGEETTAITEKTEQAAENTENALEHVKADAGEAGSTTAEQSSESKDDSNDSKAAAADAVEEDKEREKAVPSNILEKGIIYFFTRGRVSVDDPDSVQDLARSYFVLRPLPDGAKLTDGTIQDVGNNRLLALPKKVWPKSGKDRFMVFVDKAKVSMQTLKDEFFQGSEYSTQTTGTRHSPEVTPLGEGVYAMTSTGGGQGTTHLAYMLTIPSSVGEVQKDVGLAEKGSFVLSVKNPEASAPANAQLPQTAEYPKDMIEEFRGRGWMPAHPKHLDYNNASVLLIGENFDSSSNLDPAPKDEKDEAKETPQEELEKLEEEDKTRVDHLKGDDTIFADLGISSKEYPAVMTTW